MCTTYYIPHFKNLRCSTGDQQLTSYVGGTDTRPFLLVDRLVPSVGTIIFVEVFALALSHYSQSPESASNVVYSFTALPMELIQYYTVTDNGLAFYTYSM